MALAAAPAANGLTPIQLSVRDQDRGDNMYLM